MEKKQKTKINQSTSWEKGSSWYNSIVGKEGHYYHKNVILPQIEKIILNEDRKKLSVLDLCCGQGVLSRMLPKDAPYTGIDISPTLIKQAKKADKNPNHEFFVSDITEPFPELKKRYTHAFCVLAIQNVKDPALVFQNTYPYLEDDGKLTIIMNHPCFRIPRQSSWGIDEKKKIQYRRLDRYLSSMEIPISVHPSKKDTSPQLTSYHHPLSAFVQWLSTSGFLIENMDEWCSDKISTGTKAKMENRSRQEFPLFLAITAVKKRK